MHLFINIKSRSHAQVSRITFLSRRDVSSEAVLISIHQDAAYPGAISVMKLH